MQKYINKKRPKTTAPAPEDRCGYAESERGSVMAECERAFVGVQVAAGELAYDGSEAVASVGDQTLEGHVSGRLVERDELGDEQLDAMSSASARDPDVDPDQVTVAGALPDLLDPAVGRPRHDLVLDAGDEENRFVRLDGVGTIDCVGFLHLSILL